MKEPPVLVPPQLNMPFKLYVAADTQTIESALIQEFEGKERVVAYLSSKIFGCGEAFLVCLLLMYKVLALFVECRMHCIFKI
jgi:hypothetical protein